MKKSLFILLLVFIAKSAFADHGEAGKITSVIVEGDSLISVWLDGPDITTECTGGARWTLHNSDPLFKEKMSILIAAASAGKSVSLHHLTSRACGTWESNKIYYVRVNY